MSKMMTCIRHVEEIEIHRPNPLVCGHCQREYLVERITALEVALKGLLETKGFDCQGWQLGVEFMAEEYAAAEAILGQACLPLDLSETRQEELDHRFRNEWEQDMIADAMEAGDEQE